jgi:putative peptidoglycan lipid II flippase
MVKRVFELVYKEVRGLHQAAYVLGMFAFGSQLLALVRDRLLAHQFGAGVELDIYYAAFRIPDLLYVLFASTLSVYVLIPFVASRIKGDDTTEAKQLLSWIFSGFLIVYTALALLMWVCAPYVLPLLFKGMAPHMEELVSVMRILLLQPLFLGISSLFGVVTQLGHRFILYALSPLIYNIGIILGIAVLYPVWGLNGLALGVVIGAFGHMCIQVPLIQKSPLAMKFTGSVSWKTLWGVLRVSIPRALTLALQQIVLLVLVSFASSMAVGSVAVFQFAYNLQSVPLAIIGASYSIAAFPFLADLFAQKKMDAFRLHIVTALRHVTFWSVPAIGLIIVLRAHVVRVVLGSGEFNWTDTRLTAAILALLSVSLLAQAINLLMVRAFYAGGHTKTPFFVTLVGSLFAISFTWFLYYFYLHNVVFAAFLENVMRIQDVVGGEVLILALGYSVAIIIQTIVLVVLAVRQFSIPMGWFAQNLGRALSASLIGASCTYATLNIFVEGINDTAFLGILLQGALGGLMGILGIVVTYRVLRSPELKEIYVSLHSRMFRNDIVAPQEDIL